MLKRIGIIGVLVFGVVFGLQAQVEVSLEFKKDYFLAHEEMIAEVKIINFSGRTLTFGQDQEWLQFTVESVNEFPVEKVGDLDIVEKFEIPNASRGIRRVHLVPTYKMNRPGRYRITAFVNVPELNMNKVTAPVEIGLLSASVIWERPVGVVMNESDPSAPIAVRKYFLMRAVNEKSIDLYVKVTDQYEKEIYGVYTLGNIVSFGEPERQVDRFSNLHVLMQNGARTFRYTIVKPDGKVLLRQKWAYSSTRPQLSLAKNGLIEVKGGQRQPSFDDIPTPEQINEVRERNAEPVASAATGSADLTQNDSKQE